MHVSDSLTVSDHTFVVFIDETGDEKCADPQRPVFGFGGCAVLGVDLGRFIHAPWRAVRQKILGSPEAPLHAAEMPRPLNDEHILTLSLFFSSVPFCRFAVTCDHNTKIPEPFDTVRLVLESLKNRINDLLKHTWATDVAVIFEDSERLREEIQKYFANFVPVNHSRVLGCKFYFMSKSVNDPGLEVADFVVNSCNGQANIFSKRTAQISFALDFQAIFHSSDRHLVSYIHIDTATISNMANL